MTPLARAVYGILRRRVGQDDPRVTYASLARQLCGMNKAFEHLTHRSHELYAALCEIGEICKRLKLPPLPALVVRADTRRPGDAYFEGMTSIYRSERIAAWQRHLDAVRQGVYPQRV